MHGFIVGIFILVLNFGSLIYIANYSKYDGRYIPYLDLIIIKAKYSTMDDIDYTIEHEKGHLIWFRDLDEKLKEEFTNMSLGYINNDETYHCFLGYKDDVEEDFADSYMYYKMGDSFIFSDCFEKLDYFDKIIRIIG